MAKKIPTFSSRDFDWRKGSGRTTIDRLPVRDFPASFYIKSAKSGEVRLFLSDGDTMVANEFFDGEAAAYFCPGGNVSVQIWC